MSKTVVFMRDSMTVFFRLREEYDLKTGKKVL